MKIVTLNPFAGILAASLLLAPASAVLASQVDLDLEPCINGGVSASGTYETQALEDAALGTRFAVNEKDGNTDMTATPLTESSE